MELKDLKLGIKAIPWKEFVGGGILFSSIKIISENIKDVRIASIAASLPIGLISTLLIEKSKRINYSKDYLVNVLIIGAVALSFYYLMIFNISIYISIFISIIVWVVINVLRIKYTTI